ncbi:hypothetical protein [Cohnella faecalis]|nr:hypothetical protein [Cohnella faecalis]
MERNLYHVLGAKQFGREDLDRLFAGAREMEKVVAAGGDRRFTGKS